MGGERKAPALKARLLLKGFALMASLLLLGWGFKLSGLGSMLDAHWIDAEVRGHGLAGEAVFLAVATAAIAVGLPRQALCFLAGYAFGLGGGVLVASLASLAGCVLCFGYARLLGRELVNHKFHARVARVDAFLKGSPVLMTVLIRFLPVGSNLATNLVAGVSSVPAGAFLLGSFLGYLPQTVVFVLLGSGIHVDPLLRISLSVALFIASALLGLYLYKRLRHGRRLEERLDLAVGADEPPSAA